MLLVLAMLRDRGCRATWEAAVRGYGRIGFCERVAELPTRLSAAGTVDAIVVEPRDHAGSSTAPVVGALRDAYPRIPVLAYCDHRRDRSTDILALARAGVHELLFRGVDDVQPALNIALASAARHCTATELLAELTPVLTPGVRPFVAYCLEHAAEAPTVAGVASVLGVHRKTLVFRCARAGLPGPHAVIAWCRLVLAARRLEDPGRTVEEVAFELEYPSGNALRNMLRRYAGLRPVDLRSPAGARRVLQGFRQAMRGLPAPERERGHAHAHEHALVEALHH